MLWQCKSCLRGWKSPPTPNFLTKDFFAPRGITTNQLKWLCGRQCSNTGPWLPGSCWNGKLFFPHHFPIKPLYFKHLKWGTSAFRTLLNIPKLHLKWGLIWMCLRVSRMEGVHCGLTGASLREPHTNRTAFSVCMRLFAWLVQPLTEWAHSNISLTVCGHEYFTSATER